MGKKRKKSLRSRKTTAEKDVSRNLLSKSKRSVHIVRLLKTELNYKLIDIARFTGKTPSQISHVNCGRRELGIEDLENIARGTNIPIVWFFLETTDRADIPEDLRNVFDAAKLLFNCTRLAKNAGKEAVK